MTLHWMIPDDCYLDPPGGDNQGRDAPEPQLPARPPSFSLSTTPDTSEGTNSLPAGRKKIRPTRHSVYTRRPEALYDPSPGQPYPVPES
jgi:hypothetical protein